MGKSLHSIDNSDSVVRTNVNLLVQIWELSKIRDTLDSDFYYLEKTSLFKNLLSLIYNFWSFSNSASSQSIG